MPLVLDLARRQSEQIRVSEQTKHIRGYRARARGARSREMRATLLVKEHKIYLGFLVIS